MCAFFFIILILRYTNCCAEIKPNKAKEKNCINCENNNNSNKISLSEFNYMAEENKNKN